MPIFRSPDAPIPSGDLNEKDLKGGQVLETRTWNKLQNLGWIQRDALIKDIDLSRFLTTKDRTQARTKPLPALPPHLLIGANTKVEFIKRKDHWVEVRFEKKRVWVSESDLNPIDTDLGLIITKASTPLRAAAGVHAKILQTIPEKSSGQLLSFKDSWIEVKIHNLHGWLNINDTYSKMDFAKQVLFKNRWYEYDSSAGPWVRFGKISAAHISEILAVKTNSEKAIVLQTTQVRQHPSKRAAAINKIATMGDSSPVDEKETIWWSFKQTLKNGSIWWSLNEPELAPDNTPHLLKTSQEINKRGIFDILSHTKIKGLRFAAAQGVFRTLDDEKWEQLPQFGDENLPLAQTPAGTIFIGMFYSTDGGQNFRPYVRWDKVLSTLGKHGVSIPTQMKLKSITANQNEVVISISGSAANNVSDLKLVTKDLGLHWGIKDLKTPEASSLLRQISNSSDSPKNTNSPRQALEQKPSKSSTTRSYLPKKNPWVKVQNYL
jgi:SH3-like domain-containing protein